MTGAWRYGGAALVLALATGCGADASPTSAATEPATPRSLAAAVGDAVRGPAGTGPSAAARLFPRDRIGLDDLGVELAFPREGHDALHVRVVVTRDPEPGDVPDSDGERASFYAGCEEDDRAGVRTVLAWEREAPEEDPGLIVAAADRGSGEDRVVVRARASGPPVSADLGDLRDLADALVDLVADPAVGFTTTPELVREGEAIGDDVWLDYYGQGNGYPPPRRS